MGVSPQTLRFYKERLSKSMLKVDYLRAYRQDIREYLCSIAANQNGLGTRHTSFRAIKAFYHWINVEHGFSNPMVDMPAPILSKLILPSLKKNQVLYLDDDERFIEWIVKPIIKGNYNYIGYYQYAQRSKTKNEQFIRSLVSRKAKFLCLVDSNSSPCVTATKQHAKHKLGNSEM